MVTPTSMMTRAFETVGVAEIDFESEEFNRGWAVHCADRRFAMLFLDAQMIDLILTLEEKIVVETFGNYVLFATTLCKPARLVRLCRRVSQVPAILSPLVGAEYPTVVEMEQRAMTDAWVHHPNGRDGRY
ncbi:MAG TPA: hypothetical protein VGQ20_01975 [Acidimicrobiales bacterium]|nr:hypothetical protein [Acidimicrobiales bacterium]